MSPFWKFSQEELLAVMQEMVTELVPQVLQVAIETVRNCQKDVQVRPTGKQERQ